MAAVRKQLLIYPEQVKKLGAIAQETKQSEAEIIRQAINAFDPDLIDAEFPNMAELAELVMAELDDAIAKTKHTCNYVETIIAGLS